MRLHDKLREVCRMSNTDSISGGAWGSGSSENVTQIFFNKFSCFNNYKNLSQI